MPTVGELTLIREVSARSVGSLARHGIAAAAASHEGLRIQSQVAGRQETCLTGNPMSAALRARAPSRVQSAVPRRWARQT